jgi:hypothetical protein
MKTDQQIQIAITTIQFVLISTQGWLDPVLWFQFD